MQKPNRDRYFLRWITNSCDGIETKYDTPEARYAAYVHATRAGRNVEAFNLEPRWGRIDVVPVTILF